MKKLILLISLISAMSAYATDKLVSVDPTNPNNKKVSSIVITNGTVIVTTDSVAKEAVQGVTASTGVSDANKVPKIGPLGTMNTTIMGGTTVSNQFLRSVSPTNAVWTTVASGSSAPRIAVFSSSQSFTNSFGVTNLNLEVWGGGGGGGANSNSGSKFGVGGGGGGGGYCLGTLTVTNGQIIAVTVGGAGGQSTLTDGVTTLTANGGASGSSVSGNVGGTGGAGGTATGGIINITGVDGGNGSGGGAASRGGGGGPPGPAEISGATGKAGGIPGGGGGGGVTSGGAASQGLVIIWY